MIRAAIVPALLVSVLVASTPLVADYPLPPRATGRVYVSGSGSNKVFCFDRDGRFLLDFSHPDLRAPRGLAFSAGGELYCGAQGADRILVFDADGDYLRQFTDARLDGPTSLTFGPDGKLYVSSFGSNEILVFDDEVLQRSFTSDNLRGPNCIAFGPTGEIYVAAQMRNEIHRFTAGGELIGTFTGDGVSSPMGVAIWDGRVFVTGGGSDAVAVFDLAGEHIERLSTEPISGPQGIAFNQHAEFVTSSYYTGIVGRFSRRGALVGEFESVEIRTARSVAFEPLRRLTFVRGDFNIDGRFDISDAVAVLGYLFLGDRPSDCHDAADVDDDGQLQVTDAIYSLAHLFQGGESPPPPFPEAGDDPTGDELGCFGR